MSQTMTRARRPRTRLRLALVIVVVLAGVGVLAVSGLGQSLVFYRTPTELVEDPALVGQTVRVGGDVAPGSVREDPDGVSFTLSDGTTDLPVIYRGTVPAVFQEGEAALVEGVLGPDGVFHGERLMVKHSEDYRAPDQAGEGR